MYRIYLVGADRAVTVLLLCFYPFSVVFHLFLHISFPLLSLLFLLLFYLSHFFLFSHFFSTSSSFSYFLYFIHPSFTTTPLIFLLISFSSFSFFPLFSSISYYFYSLFYTSFTHFIYSSTRCPLSSAWTMSAERNWSPSVHNKSSNLFSPSFTMATMTPVYTGIPYASRISSAARSMCSCFRTTRYQIKPGIVPVTDLSCGRLREWCGPLRPAVTSTALGVLLCYLFLHPLPIEDLADNSGDSRNPTTETVPIGFVA